MKRGRKGELPSVKIANGTYREDEDGHRIDLKPEEMKSGKDIPLPDWLTPEAKKFWLDNVDKCVPPLIEADTNCFAMYANLMGFIAISYRNLKSPGLDRLVEARRLAEAFGLCGAKSRVVDAPPSSDTANPFKTRRRANGWSAS
jgi:phage terminase small subunit